MFSKFELNIIAMGYFKENLKHLRTHQELTQQEVANILKVNVKSYQSWESGRAEPSHEVIGKISKMYWVNYEDLVMNDLTTMQPQQTTEHYFITKYNLAPNNIKQAIDKLLGI